MRTIFVDGYNVINQWDELKKLKDENLEDARDKLVEMLQEYAAYKGCSIFVVFDAHLVPGSIEKNEKSGKINIVFTKEGETADCFIERSIYQYLKSGAVAVVTSDYLEQRITLQMGGIRITPNEFLHELKAVENVITEKSKISYSQRKNTLEEFINKDILEKLERMRRNL
ncbi:NYN domain-containing protein [Caloramator mitchellensis]|uniref:NYN domain-containing protein n=1 Tax=Caloramator mitchellensis TaxID=908809 RepID=UPI000716EC7C|nr:NYN domain-containing protein [Caloramator mitchellensis]